MFGATVEVQKPHMENRIFAYPKCWNSRSHGLDAVFFLLVNAAVGSKFVSF